MNGTVLVLIGLGAAGCAASFPRPMTAGDLARLDSGEALVAYLHAPGASPAVCDLRASGPHLTHFDAGVATALVDGLADGRIEPDLWRACADRVLASAPPVAAAALFDAVAHGYRDLFKNHDLETSPALQARLAAMQRQSINDRAWHLTFNRLQKINEQLVKGREDAFFGWEFDAAARKLPADVVDYYVRRLTNPDALRASFEFYRALDTTIAQDQQRKTRRLKMPVLAIGGAASFGGHVADAVKLVADDVEGLVIPGTGHFVAEEAPDEMLAALTAFLGPYRDERQGSDQTQGSHLQA